MKEEYDWKGKGEKRRLLLKTENRIRVIKQIPKRHSFGNKERKNKKAITKGEENDWRGKGEKRMTAIED